MHFQLMLHVIEKKGKFFIANEDILFMKMGTYEPSYSQLQEFMQNNRLELVEKNVVMSVIQKIRN